VFLDPNGPGRLLKGQKENGKTRASTNKGRPKTPPKKRNSQKEVEKWASFLHKARVLRTPSPNPIPKVPPTYFPGKMAILVSR